MPVRDYFEPYLNPEELDEFGRDVLQEMFLDKFSGTDFVNMWNNKFGHLYLVNSANRPIDDVPKMVEAWRTWKNAN